MGVRWILRLREPLGTSDKKAIPGFTALMFCKSSQAGAEKRRGLNELQGRARECEDHKQPTSSCISGTGSNVRTTASEALGLQPTPDEALWKKPH